ncbi:MAG: dihydroorotate dehydrogenase electron transfer subunit [Dehalococcoidia bacterium]|nr:dihydroorotate dehydrogenase electron transfer subunit [Dehalococcoidia bacterium]
MDGKVLIKANVRSSLELMPGTRLLWLDAPAIAAAAHPGQFLMIRCGEDHDPVLRRPLSIHRTNSSGGVALLFEVVGRGTRWLAERVPGDCVDVLGPLGNGFMVRDDARDVLLVAGGIGIAPLAFLAEKMTEEGKKRVILLHGARRGELLLPEGQLPGATTVVDLSEDGSRGRRCLATDVMDEYAGEADQVFACGPAAMYRAMAELECLKGKSVQVSLEERMACGLGACYVCTIRTTKGLKQVCRDGPVFELADILWER